MFAPSKTTVPSPPSPSELHCGNAGGDIACTEEMQPEFGLILSVAKSPRSRWEKPMLLPADERASNLWHNWYFTSSDQVSTVSSRCATLTSVRASIPFPGYGPCGRSAPVSTMGALPLGTKWVWDVAPTAVPGCTADHAAPTDKLATEVPMAAPARANARAPAVLIGWSSAPARPLFRGLDVRTQLPVLGSSGLGKANSAQACRQDDPRKREERLNRQRCAASIQHATDSVTSEEVKREQRSRIWRGGGR